MVSRFRISVLEAPLLGLLFSACLMFGWSVFAQGQENPLEYIECGSVWVYDDPSSEELTEYLDCGLTAVGECVNGQGEGNQNGIKVVKCAQKAGAAGGCTAATNGEKCTRTVDCTCKEKRDANNKLGCVCTGN